MSGDPLVSICIPTYNRAHVLGRSIRSALSQTYTNIEVIVSDNASTDDTQELMKSFDDRRLHYQRHDENIGVGMNFKSAIQASTGEYFLMLCSDDWIEPYLLQRGVAVLSKHPRVGVYHTAFNVVDECGTIIEPSSSRAPIGESRDIVGMLQGNCVGLLTAIVRRVCYERVGPPVDHPAGDWILWLRILLDGWSLWYDPRPSASYTISSDADSVNLNSMYNSQKLEIYINNLIQNGYENFRWAARKGIANQYYGAGVWVRKSGRIGPALTLYLRAFRLYPFDMRIITRMCLVFIPSGIQTILARLVKKLLKPRFSRLGIARSNNGRSHS